MYEIPIHQEIALGFAKETIAAHANKRQDIDLIAIGTNDKHSLSKIIWGTIISKTVAAAKAPVLVIPKGITYQDIKNVAYLTPVVKDWHAVYPQVRKMVDDFAAKLYIIHLPQAKYGEIEGENHVVLDDYASALNSFAYNVNLHLLVTMAGVSSMKNTLQRIFRYSKAQKMAINATIPLLVFRNPADA